MRGLTLHSTLPKASAPVIRYGIQVFYISTLISIALISMLDQLLPSSADPLVLAVILALLALQSVLIFQPMARMLNDERQALSNEIAQHKRTILELNQIEAQLHRSEHFQQRILSTIPDIVYVLDLDENRIVYSNQQIDETLGFTPEQVYALDVQTMRSRFHPDDLRRLIEQRAAHTHLKDDEVLEAEFRVRACDNSWHTIHSREMVFARAADGRPKAMLGVAHDVTRRVTAERQALEAEAERLRMQALSDFIRSTSHDLRTPLTVLGTGLYLLRKIDDRQRQIEKIDSMEQHLRHLSELLEQLQTMAVLDSLKELPLQATNVNYLARWITEAQLERAARQGLTLTCALDSSLPDVDANITELGNALNGVLDNAIVYSTHGGTVTVRTLFEGEQVIIEVEDTGIGISEEDLPRIFERLYKADKARAFGTGGAGLGLAMVRRIVDLHRGRIEVSSTLGKGTRVRILLPPSAGAEITARSA